MGGVLAGADAGSSSIVDAHVAALAVESGGGVVVDQDLGRLAAPYPHVVVERI